VAVDTGAALNHQFSLGDKICGFSGGISVPEDQFFAADLRSILAGEANVASRFSNTHALQPFFTLGLRGGCMPKENADWIEDQMILSLCVYLRNLESPTVLVNNCSYG
jgi:hypothetical protein